MKICEIRIIFISFRYRKILRNITIYSFFDYSFARVLDFLDIFEIFSMILRVFEGL